MSDTELLSRITVDPRIMVGKPVVRGTRLTVEFLVDLLAHGATPQEILSEYEGLTDGDIRACLLFAKSALENATFLPLDHPQNRWVTSGSVRSPNV